MFGKRHFLKPLLPFLSAALLSVPLLLSACSDHSGSSSGVQCGDQICESGLVCDTSHDLCVDPSQLETCV